MKQGMRFELFRMNTMLMFFRTKLLTRRIRSKRQSGPPPNAQFLFYLFLDAQNCDAIVGDLEERYRLIHKRFDARRANFWYWTQAIRSHGADFMGVGEEGRIEAGDRRDRLGHRQRSFGRRFLAGGTG